MVVLSEETLIKTEGGSQKILYIIGGIVCFVFGFFEGLFNPGKCNK